MVLAKVVQPKGNRKEGALLFSFRKVQFSVIIKNQALRKSVLKITDDFLSNVLLMDIS